MLNRELDEFIRLFDEVPPRLKADKIEMAEDIISRYKIAERYLEGLDGDDRLRRQVELLSKRRQSRKERFKPLATDKIARERGIPRKGACTAKWHAKYDATTNAEKARITGIPKKILDKVENKGKGAFYSSGSRPGQTAKSWGVARVNCFIMNKKTVTAGPDKALYIEARKSPKAKKWFDRTKF